MLNKKQFVHNRTRTHDRTFIFYPSEPPKAQEKIIILGVFFNYEVNSEIAESSFPFFVLKYHYQED